MDFPVSENNDPRSQESLDYKHLVLLFEKGEPIVKHDELKKIVTEKLGENVENIILHHLVGGDIKNGGIYPSIVRACSSAGDLQENVTEYRPKNWYVEPPGSEFGEENWELCEKSTIAKMKEFLTRNNNKVDVWMSSKRLERNNHTLS